PTTASPNHEPDRREEFPSTHGLANAVVPPRRACRDRLSPYPDGGGKLRCDVLRDFPTKLRGQISSDGTERDDSRLREHTTELARWHPGTPSFFSQFFF